MPDFYTFREVDGSATHTYRYDALRFKDVPVKDEVQLAPMENENPTTNGGSPRRRRNETRRRDSASNSATAPSRTRARPDAEPKTATDSSRAKTHERTRGVRHRIVTNSGSVYEEVIPVFENGSETNSYVDNGTEALQSSISQSLISINESVDDEPMSNFHFRIPAAPVNNKTVWREVSINDTALSTDSFDREVSDADYVSAMGPIIESMNDVLVDEIIDLSDDDPEPVAATDFESEAEPEVEPEVEPDIATESSESEQPQTNVEAINIENIMESLAIIKENIVENTADNFVKVTEADLPMNDTPQSQPEAIINAALVAECERATQMSQAQAARVEAILQTMNRGEQARVEQKQRMTTPNSSNAPIVNNSDTQQPIPRRQDRAAQPDRLTRPHAPVSPVWPDQVRHSTRPIRPVRHVNSENPDQRVKPEAFVPESSAPPDTRQSDVSVRGKHRLVERRPTKP